VEVHARYYTRQLKPFRMPRPWAVDWSLDI
jgi:hypothetical protein